MVLWALGDMMCRGKGMVKVSVRRWLSRKHLEPPLRLWGLWRLLGSPPRRLLTYPPSNCFGLACGSPAAYLLTPQRFGRPAAARLLTYQKPYHPPKLPNPR